MDILLKCQLVVIISAGRAPMPVLRLHGSRLDSIPLIPFLRKEER
jgi:hypothetical protein